MQKFTGSVAAKTAAVILSYAAVLIFVLSLTATAIMGYYKFYFSNEPTVKEEILTDMAQNESYYIHRLLDRGANLSKYYADKNVYYEIIEFGSDKVLETNWSGEKYCVTASSEYYTYDEVQLTDKEGDVYWTMVENHTATINVYIAESMTKNDLFSVTAKIVELGFKLEYAVIVIMLISLIAAIALLCFLYASAGHRKNGKIRLNFIDRIPFDIYAAFIALAAILSVLIIGNLYDNSLFFYLVLWLVATVDYFLGLGFTLSFATRIKTRSLIKNTVIYKLLKFIFKYIKRFFNWLKFVFSGLSLVKKTLFIITGLIFIEFLCLLIIFNSHMFVNDELFLLILIPLNLIFILGFLYFAVILQRIRTGGEKIAGGDLDYKIDTEYMYGDFKDFSESLNNINMGLQTAVNERMKSERFKTELITNVSHDIKTPLTSIINYVDLIKKEKPENENIRQYIEVLDRQSSRLKKLVEDLVEASKASSGALAVSLAPCDASVLLSQALGEFEDRLSRAEITPVLNVAETSPKILADGRHLWRVFDNLLSNVCKYALNGTRVYLDIFKKSGRVYITFRNISKNQLNISADELMERFVRGDSSRNTEGSGLGLSIAKSLVELQNGELNLEVDGDLFKVTVSFEAI